MKKILVMFLVVLVGASLYTTPVAADCWNWSISEKNLMVTLKSHTPNTVTSVTVPDWYYPSNQSTRDAIQTVINALKVVSFVGIIGAEAIINAYESTGGLPVSAIGDRVFEHYTSLKQVRLPESVRSIGEYAFFHCYALESFYIPQGVTRISEGTFASCVRLRDIALPFGLTSIGKSAFEGCSELQYIEIPNTVSEIGYAAFSGCASLESLKLEEGLQQIGNYAFYECDSLEWVKIPESVTYIGENAFYGCSPFIYTMNNYVIDYAKSHGLPWNYSELVFGM